MTSRPSSSHPEWSRLRWFGLVGTLAALQSALLVGFVRWPSPPQPPAQAGPDLSLSLALPGGSPGAADPFVSDPRQFALPDPSGFSGTAHRALPSPQYRFMEWKGEMRWLGLGQPGAQLGNVPSPPALPVATPPAPRVSGPADPSATPLLLPRQNAVQIRGTLSGRAYEPANPLPPATGGDILSPTVIEIQVDPSGDVMRARLVSSSGSRDADLAGLQWARNLQFRAAGLDSSNTRSNPSSWAPGELVIYWHVETPLR